MKKKNIKRILAICLILIIDIIALSIIQSSFGGLDDPNAWRIREFYKEKNNTIDVVFIGASEVTSGYCSSLAYDMYGYTSYPLATDSATVELWKSQIRELSKHQSPSVIIIEINGLLYDEDDYSEEARFRRYLDATPLSLNKIQTVIESDVKESAFSYFFPLIKYHGSFSNMLSYHKEQSYYNNKECTELKGFTTYTAISKPNNEMNIKKNYQEQLSKKAEKGLYDFLEFCKSQNASNILFVRFPHRIETEEARVRYYRTKYAEEIIKSYGYDFLNFEEKKQEIGINPDTDYYNAEHLNIYGAEKLTKYIGETLYQSYAFTPINQTTEVADEWNHSAKIAKSLFEYADNCIKAKENVFICEDVYSYSQLEAYFRKE